MKKSTILKDFSSLLHCVSLASFLIKIMAVPVGLIQAQLMSDVVMSATAGDF